LQSLKERSAFAWATFIWLAWWVLLLAIAIAWLATLGFAIYGSRIYRGRALIDFLAGYAFLLFILGAAFVFAVNKSYDWWREQRLKSVLKEIEARTTTPEQRLDDLLKQYESRVTLNFPESMKNKLASSPAFQATVTEATKLILEAVVFQNNPHDEVEREKFQRAWQAKFEKLSERIAQEDPLSVEVILKAIEKESQGAGRGWPRLNTEKRAYRRVGQPSLAGPGRKRMPGAPSVVLCPLPPNPPLAPPPHVVESHQINLLASTVLRHLQQI